MKLTTKAYFDIAEFYGSKTAARSGIPLINHIDEGLDILAYMQASPETLDAWCVHPFFQSGMPYNLNHISLETLSYALEYRDVANACLPPHYFGGKKPATSKYGAVNQMLIADKVQNYKDFRACKVPHERAGDLCLYFGDWLKELGINTARRHELEMVIGQYEEQ